jgi:hypothetical protein
MIDMSRGLEPGPRLFFAQKAKENIIVSMEKDKFSWRQLFIG